MHRPAPRRLAAATLFLATALAAFQAPLAADAKPHHHKAPHHKAHKAHKAPHHSAARAGITTLPLDAVALNDKGLVAGTVSRDGATRAATWQNGRLRLLPLPTGATAARANDVNDDGVVGGAFTGADGATHAVLWVDGRPRPLTEPEPAFGEGGPPVQSSVSAVDDRGDAAGAVDAGDGWGAASWRDAVSAGSSSPLTRLGSGAVEELNDAGLTLMTFPGALGERPLLRCAFSDCATRLQPLPSDQDPTLVASGLNDQRAVGYQYPTFQSEDLSQVRPLWWDTTGAPHGLPTPAGDGAARAREINDKGEVLGDYQSSPSTFELLLWSGGDVRRLGVPGRAVDLNDKGQILVRDGAEVRLLTPRGPGV